MKKTFLSAFFTATILLAANAQRCGTMDLLDSLYQKYPELRAKHDSLDRATQARIVENYPWTQPTKGTFPPIPGFVETENWEEDIKNYGLAKQALYQKDPDEYYKLTRTYTTKKR